MNRYLKYSINGLMAAIIAGGGAYLASDGSDRTIVISLVTALMAFAKDVQSHATLPPV